MGVVVPIASALSGIGGVVTGLFNNETVEPPKIEKGQQVEALKFQQESLNIERQTAKFYYRKAVDESVRKRKARDSTVIGLFVVLSIIAIIVTVKIK